MVILCYIDYLLTPWCRVLLEQLTGLQSVKKFPTFHGTRRFITALTSVRHLSILGQPNAVHILTSHRSVLILSTHLSRGLPSGLLPSGFPTKTLYNPLLTHTRHMPSPSHSSRFYHPLNIGWAVQIIYLLVMQSPPFPRYLLPSRSKYSPLRHVLKLPQLPFLPQFQRPRFTPIQNNRQNYSSIYLDL
jgi:hypothetical protein